jgi:hypothetical protein
MNTSEIAFTGVSVRMNEAVAKFNSSKATDDIERADIEHRFAERRCLAGHSDDEHR